MRPRLAAAICAVATAASATAVRADSGDASHVPGRSSGVVPAVIGIVGEPSALNVLHADFRTRDGRDAVLPTGMPTPVRVTLPHTGSFAHRLAQVASGRLGHLRADTLYYVAGTRLLVYAPKRPSGEWTRDVVSGDRLHPTGVVDSAIGLRYGTDPDALAVFVAGAGPSPWDWVAQQPWIDVVSTSAYGSPEIYASSSSPSGSLLCQGADAVRRIVASGRLVFATAGNSTDEGAQLTSPNGLPEVYFVGGVDEQGRTWLPGHTQESNPWVAFGTVMRPYDTGELFSFPAASPDSLRGTSPFGGTSGATPRTAGWAARLITEARQLTASSAGRGAYSDGRAMARGPLADGRLTGPELRRLLRHVAVPAEPPGPERYFVEGYGALNRSAVALATRVLRGVAAEPERPDEDAAAAATAQARSALFSPARCAA